MKDFARYSFWVDLKGGGLFGNLALSKIRFWDVLNTPAISGPAIVSQDHGHAIGHGANTIRMLPIRALRVFLLRRKCLSIHQKRWK